MNSILVVNYYIATNIVYKYVIAFTRLRIVSNIYLTCPFGGGINIRNR